MKKNRIFILVIFLCFFHAASAQYNSHKISLLGHWFNPSEPAEPFYGIKYQGVFGWADTVNNKEYAIIGSGSGTYIIDVSIPTNPIVSDFVLGRKNNCIWREYKTYGNYLYAISDDDPYNSFQIIDLSYLPDSVHVVHDDTTIFEFAHTLYIDGDKLYCSSVTLSGGSEYYSLAVYSLANPELPSLLRTLDEDDPAISSVHDVFVRNDTVYASCGYQGLFVYKFNDNNTFTPINSLTSYPDQGYNHSSSLTPNGHTLVFCDEVPRNMGVKIIDVSDLQNISVESTFKSTEGATPHNPYIYSANRVVIAYFQDGLQIYDISNPANPIKTGCFDTDTIDGVGNNYNIPNAPYHGCWGAYVHLPSGIILASDMQNGLFVLNADLALGINNLNDENNINNINVNLFPNPISNSLSMSFELKLSESLLFEIFDTKGCEITSKKEFLLAGNHTKTINVDKLSSGVYLLKITGNKTFFAKKIVKN